MNSVLYVDQGTGISIYAFGKPVGYLSMWELEDTEGEPEAAMMMQYGGNAQSYFLEDVQEKVEKDGSVRTTYFYRLTEAPFTFGDTEWLLQEGVFSDMDEALTVQDTNQSRVVVFRKTGSPYAFHLLVDGYMVPEELWQGLLGNISISTEHAFTEAVYKRLNREYQNLPGQYGEQVNIFSMENADRITYEIQAEDMTYAVPEGAVALRDAEDPYHWKLYHYWDDLVGEVKVLSADVSQENRQQLIQQLLNVEYDPAQLQETDSGWSYSCFTAVPLFGEEDAVFLAQNPNGAAIAGRQIYWKHQVLASEDSGAVMIVSHMALEDPANYLDGNWDGSYYLHRVTEDGVLLESAGDGRYHDELQKYGKLWVPFAKEQAQGYDAEFFSCDIEPTFPVSIKCTYEEFLQSWTPERQYTVHFNRHCGTLTVDRIEPVEKNDDDFSVWDGLIYRIRQSGDQLELMRVEYIHETDTERIEELRRTEGLELTEDDFDEFFGYYKKLYEEEIQTVYLQDGTRYYFMGSFGTERVSLEDMIFYESEYPFLGNYRVLLDGDKVVWIAEHGLP